MEGREDDLLVWSRYLFQELECIIILVYTEGNTHQSSIYDSNIFSRFRHNGSYSKFLILSGFSICDRIFTLITNAHIMYCMLAYICLLT